MPLIQTTILNLSLFIARRITGSRKASFSRFIINLATVATALSVAIMIVAAAVVLGFKDTIKDKLFVFWGEVQVASYNPDPTNIVTPEPFTYSASLQKQIQSVPEVAAVYPFVVKPAILNTGKLLQGVKLKGVDSQYLWQGNAAISYQGAKPNFADSSYAHDIVPSTSLLQKLQLCIGDTLLVCFVSADEAYPRFRKLRISGSYHTGMEEIDNNFCLCDMRLLQRVNNWKPDDINGYQVALRNGAHADSVANHIYRRYLEPPMNRSTLQELYPNIINWLELMNTNAYIILAIMAVVAIVNLSTALLIFIMERTNMVGTLKTLGMSNAALGDIFLYHAVRVAFKGIVLGTALGVGFCLLQQYTHFVKLDESAYYMAYAPIKLIGWHVLLIDAGTLLCCMVFMLLPVLMVRGISIVHALRFK
ncbi:MAG: ABC transporter permease [Edaphocola sp.]